MVSARTVLAFALGSALVVGLAGVGGCASNKEKAHDELLAQASTFRESLKKIPPQLDEVSKRMSAAGTGQNKNRADDVREFSKSLAKLREQGRMVASEAARAEVDTQKYFTAWAEQAQHANMADRPAARSGYMASRENADTAMRYLSTARDNFRQLMASLDSMEAKLKADQSESGIMAIQKDFGTATVKTMELRNYIDRLNESIDAALAKK